MFALVARRRPVLALGPRALRDAVIEGQFVDQSHQRAGQPQPLLLPRHMAVRAYRAGDIDAYDVDETIHHYHRAARELREFCWSSGGSAHLKLIAHLIDEQTADGQTIDWWQRGTPPRR